MNTNIHEKLLYKLQLSVLMFFSVSVLSAQAADLYFKESVSSIGIGEAVRIDMFLSSVEGANALEGHVTFPQDTLTLERVEDGNSIVSLWVERPHKTNEGVVFSGVIPGGYFARDGKIFSLVFRGRKEGQALVSLAEARVLLHDGAGSEGNLSIVPASIRIFPASTGAKEPFEEENIPPEDFTPIVAQDPNLFDGQWFVAFTTQDKNSGISHYEILESRKKLSDQGLGEHVEWQKAETPYKLLDQELTSYIYIRAIDHQGNERIAAIEPLKKSFYQQPYVLAAGFLLILLVGWILRRWLHHRGKQTATGYMR